MPYGSRFPESSIRRGCGGSLYGRLWSAFTQPRWRAALRLGRRRCFRQGLEQDDEDIIGRDSCRGRDAGVQVLQQRQSRLSERPETKRISNVTRSSVYSMPTNDAVCR